MKRLHSHCSRLGKALLATLALAMLPPLFPAGAAHAAGLAEEHTVLYYLIEMQRRFKKNCDGVSMPEAPSLAPSSALRGLAERSATSDQSPDDFAKANGLGGIPFLAVSLPAQSAQDAFDRLNAAQCPNLMSQDFHYVGAAKTGGQWTVYLAGAEPGSLPTAANAPGGPAAPGSAEPVEIKTDSGTAAAPNRSSAPAAAQEKAEAISPSVSTPAPSAGAAPAPLSVTYVAATRETYNPNPAPSVPVATVPTDSSGRVLGNPQPITPSSASQIAPGADSGAPRAPIYVPPGGAGPVNDPAAPAAPVVTQEFIISPTGKISGPLKPGTLPSETAPAPTDGGVLPPISPYAPPTSPEPQSAAPRPGVVPLFEQGAAGNQGVFASGQTASTAETRLSGATAAPAENARLLDMVNQARVLGQMCGGTRLPPASPLRFNPVITTVAQAHADDMAAKNYFSSTSPQGRSLGQRVTASGYAWTFVAENIASVTPPADNALQSWLADANQCRNLMSPDYTDAGIGYNAARNLWVFTLAAPMQDNALKLQ